ncbi:hypothetical protein A1Q1_04143 [Trichosporon asahii var. asahii CBS 2479]|uniref:Uncharacterized protein n=1 Tax=Trichosporon asahii var. asahii (strain ATCC 90039 / CBS 2479 / JCM 2466 / KCTC 7840 / NBRC 103889/ NCYC 2677 / UAMH 7654) TaxID=1186058 RepID=J4U969_TRIAS|nr:hypothetical protein A1Q1_04143 [Trichosporon asahii var. asahii CBS 2479]EJT47150.1 hypothetical protein A1Q1_04143 [Trichosporon asahii var. asahii CBS 2479]
MLRTLNTTATRFARTYATSAAHPPPAGQMTKPKRSLTYMASLLGLGFGGSYAALRMAFGRPPPPLMRAVPDHPRARRVVA